MSPTEIRSHSLDAWMAFIRPKTFGIAISPVIAALSLAFFEKQSLSFPIAVSTLLLSILMQSISNMENDLGYTEKKAERNNRKGLPRATTNGWISVQSARRAIIFTILLALSNTAYLVVVGGKIFAVIGIASLMAAYMYMGGKKPIAYTPYGELTVLFFFGLTAVCGTYYLQTHNLSLASILLGVSLGSIASLVLAVNNWRDRNHDFSINRRTLAVVTNEQLFLKIISTLLIIPFLGVAFIVLNKEALWPCLTVVLCLPAAKEIQTEVSYLKNEALNKTMFKCVLLEVKFAFLFSIGVYFAYFLSI